MRNMRSANISTAVATMTKQASVTKVSLLLSGQSGKMKIEMSYLKNLNCITQQI